MIPEELYAGLELSPAFKKCLAAWEAWANPSEDGLSSDERDDRNEALDAAWAQSIFDYLQECVSVPLFQRIGELHVLDRVDCWNGSYHDDAKTTWGSAVSEALSDAIVEFTRLEIPYMIGGQVRLGQICLHTVEDEACTRTGNGKRPSGHSSTVVG